MPLDWTCCFCGILGNVDYFVWSASDDEDRNYSTEKLYLMN